MKRAIILLTTILLLFSLVACKQDVSKNELATDTQDPTNLIEELQEKVEYLELTQVTMEDEITNLKNSLPNQDLTDFIATTSSDLERINELLNKTDAIETIYGIITGISKEEQVSFNVLLVEVDNDGKSYKTKQDRKIKCESDFTPYMVGQYSLASISSEEFINFIEKNLKNNFEEVFTLKIINGKIVQIYQGTSFT